MDENSQTLLSNLPLQSRFHETNFLDQLLSKKLEECLPQNSGMISIQGFALSETHLHKIANWFLDHLKELDTKELDMLLKRQTIFLLNHLSLTFLPSSFLGSLSSYPLKTLDISHNQLLHFPCGLHNLLTLTELTLDHNRIIDWQDDHHQKVILPKSLKTLSLQDNQLHDIPEVLREMVPLIEWIVLEDNPLKTHDIPANLLQNPSLSLLFNSRLAQEIVPGLYLGGSDTIRSKSFLLDHNIGAIINISGENYLINDDIQSLHLTAVDLPEQDIFPFFSQVFTFIQTFQKSEKRNILIHCAAGMSRSGALMISYVMKSQGISFGDALVLVRKKRCCVKPNPGFCEQLLRWESQILTH